MSCIYSMLDLGETETTIAEKTGFSRSTVRHRLNLAKLDQETLTRREKNKDFQLTLTDLYELEKVQDIKKRNEILKTAVSSREIAWKAKQAVKEEKIKKNAQIVFEILEEKGVKAAPKRAKEERWTGKWKEITNIDLSQWEDQTKIDLQDTKDQLYYYQYMTSSASEHKDATDLLRGLTKRRNASWMTWQAGTII